MDFGQPNVEIGWKVANGQLLFLALDEYTHKKYIQTYWHVKLKILNFNEERRFDLFKVILIKPNL